MYLIKKPNILLSCFLIFLFSLVKGQDAQSITQQMISTVKSMQSLSYTSDLKERVNGTMKTEKASFKINVSPFNIYMYQYFPKLGAQCLYVTGKNGGKARVNTNSFPWITLSLLPEGTLMLEKRHHSVFDAGFLYTALTLENLLNKYQNDKVMTMNGIVKMQGADCYYITFTNPNYRMVNYTTQPNETPQSIAKKINLNFYSILENNPKLKVIDQIKPGTKLIIPTNYASKMEIYIHKDKFYPVCLRVYDNKGLYEEYSFFDVLINPQFKEIDFSEDNPNYGF
jgi:outer membrane lipoprotein-sorting protein